MIRRDLDRAIGYARLTGLQSYLMQYAREQSYTLATIAGINDDLPFTVNLTQLAEAIGCHRKPLFLAYTELVESGIWIIEPGKLHRINKNYQEWRIESGKEKGRLRFTPRQLDQIRAADDLGTRPTTQFEVGQKCHTSDADDQGKNALPLGQKCHSDQGKNALVNGQKCPSADAPPHRNAHVRESESKREQESNTLLNAAADITPPHTYTHTRETPAAAEVEKPVRATTSRELSDWYNATYPDDPEYLGGKLPGFVAGYPVDQVQEAVEAAMVSAKRGLAAYVAATLRQWKADPERRLGKPNAPEASATSATPPKRGPYTLADKRAEQSRLRRAEAERETREALAKIAAEESAGIGGIHAR